MKTNFLPQLQMDFSGGISTRYINEFDYRTINRLVDDARV